MTANPVVAVLHAETVPDTRLLAPVAEHAEIRYTDSDGLATVLEGADVLFVYDFLTDALPHAWHAAESLRWVHAAAAGVDPIMFPALRDSDVIVTNSRGVFDQPIAEYVLAQILSFAKDLPESLRLQREHTWRHRESERIAGRTALVVGTGPIGRAIARLLTAVGMKVRGSGRRARDDDPDFGIVTATEDLPEELSGADFVVVAAPLTEQTRGMFDTALFGAMKPSARFVNVGRGDLVRTDDLVEALRSGEIAGAALDVVDIEPLPPEHPLWDIPNVMITPHNSGDFTGWRDALVDVFVDNFQRWRSGGDLENVVDKRLGYVPST
ncbi:phosphoglycerate dehydrogenase-like enzyme [Rhodococcus sp. SMB37]|uniref:D-2-hydroxyacid dehydrogenase n=1 Tax=Rhodococcus sp. SMB37 TaxID=2512213 RepID=UPI00104BF5FF|nr:D-2-hydroxyacid dehydrogenase [Rhodococcus sp. SMB37]TCN51273.1 phosphoglycerate dehydrogenase-like enzyme [Rhodococcus sp. SMB37]